MIKNVILDFGNVIGTFDEDYILGLYYETPEDRQLAKGPILSGWATLDAGRIDYDVYIKNVLDKLPQRLYEPTRAFFADWYRHLPYVGGIDELTTEVKNMGLGLYLLSNAPVVFSENRDFYKILKKFDGIVFSGDIQLAKPGPEIYEYILNKYSLNPRECVFADDREDNIETARRFGIDGYLFRNDASKFLEYIKRNVLSDEE